VTVVIDDGCGELIAVQRICLGMVISRVQIWRARLTDRVVGVNSVESITPSCRILVTRAC
jgi:hypothetical protein